MINPSLAGAIPNDSWITKDDYPDPEVLPELPGYHVLVRLSLLRQKPKEASSYQKSLEMTSPISPRWGVYSKLENLPTKIKKSFSVELGAEWETMFVIKN